MEVYYNKEDFDINLIETLLEVRDDLGKERTNKLITLLEKKKRKRYSIENKYKDLQKSLRKYKARSEVTCKKR